MSDDQHTSGYLRLLRRRRDFRNLWLGQLISFAGDWFNFIALYTAVQSISSSGKAVAAVMVAKMLPIFLISPVAGPLVDRLDRRKLLIATEFVRAGLAVGLVISYEAGSLVGLYACTIVMMCGTGIAVPTRNAIMPMILSRDDIPAANALSGGTWSIMLAIGAGLGGIATAFLGVTASFLIDGATFLVGALFFARLPALPPPTGDDAEPNTTFMEGVRYLLRNRYIMALVSLKSLMQFAGGLVTLIPFYGTDVFSEADGPMFVGILFATRGVGAAIGSLGVRVIFGDRKYTMRWLLLVGYIVAALSYLSLSQSGAYWHVVLAYFGAALGQSTVWVFSGTLLQMEGDRSYHGRVFAIEFGLNTLMLGASSFLVGAAIDWGWSFQKISVVFASGSLLPIAMWSLVLLSRRRSNP